MRIDFLYIEVSLYESQIYFGKFRRYSGRFLHITGNSPYIPDKFFHKPEPFSSNPKNRKNNQINCSDSPSLQKTCLESTNFLDKQLLVSLYFCQRSATFPFLRSRCNKNPAKKKKPNKNSINPITN